MTESTYRECIKAIDSKIAGELDMDWSEIKDKYNINCNPDTIRKASTTPFGGYFRSEYLKNQIYTNPDEFSKERELDDKLREIKKERMKLQTLNIERNRIDRNEARHELYYEYIADAITTLPVPELIKKTHIDNSREYILTIADIHYGANFKSTNNEYSPEIAQERFEYLIGYVEDFVEKHQISKLNILELGDSVQGCIRLSDLKINDSSVVKATVEISRIIANFLNEISAFVEVDYYHVPSANHSQLRPLGSKASEIADEDLEYVISNYIKDSLKNNSRVRVHLAKDGDQYLDFSIKGFGIIAGHGHTIKNLDKSLRDLNTLRGSYADYIILGHYHGGFSKTVSEGITSDDELIVANSFIGSDPYSDSLMTGSKAACQILGFDGRYGHTETYKIILN